MGSHPLNLMLRFILELTALGVLGMWGWQEHTGWLRLVLAAGLPLVAAAVWGIFAVPHDPSRSGAAPVPIPGLWRLVLEWAIFTAAVGALHDMGLTTLSWLLGGIVLAHYMASYDRVIWLSGR